jgi:phenylpropionate dioxygenase-like ring-hydroxylating dioxygenase large terminal subunit
MFKNFWYALAFSDEITATPSRHRILAQDLVLWRSPQGQVRALSDLCVHRGARLSEGHVKGDNIVCPYHGWGYGADGACSVIPANGRDRPVSKKARVDSYPVEERHGWVWVFMGDNPEEDRVPIPDMSFMEDPSYRMVRGTWHWDANYERVVENGTDQSHTPFVHGGVFGNPDEPEVTDFEIEAGEWWARLTVDQKSEQAVERQSVPAQEVHRRSAAGNGANRLLLPGRGDDRPDHPEAGSSDHLGHQHPG